MSKTHFLLASWLGLLVAGAAAQTPAVYLEGASSPGAMRAFTVGTTLDWGDWQRPLGSGVLTGHWDAYLSRWHQNGIGHNQLWLLGVVPVLRWTPGQGQSRWFLQGGIGVTVMDHLYRTPEKRFSTAFNFASHLGVGLRFGAQSSQEVMLRVQHLSNASIKRPNPGVNSVHLRYAMRW